VNSIYAIVGMCGSGKSTACDILKENGWQYIRFGQITIDKLLEKGMEINPENEKKMRESLRDEQGMGVFALLCISKINNALERGNVVIDGLYSWSEYKILKEKYKDNIKIICIHTSPSTRYKRLSIRKQHSSDKEIRMRTLTENQAKNRDYSEIENIEKGGPIAMADIMIINEKSEDNLKTQILRIING